MVSIVDKNVELTSLRVISIILFILFTNTVVNQRPANVVIMNKDGKEEENVPGPERPLRFPYNYYNNIVTRPIESVKEKLRPPLRDYTPINVPTRGLPTAYQQIGILTPALEVASTPIPGSSIAPRILPLYGRQLYSGSDKWNYYITTDGYQSVKIPITNNNRDCMHEHGCREIYDGDVLDVPIYNQEFKATVYNLSSPRYIPYI